MSIQRLRAMGLAIAIRNVRRKREIQRNWTIAASLLMLWLGIAMIVWRMLP